jgi:hypothetical protein
MLPYPTSPRVWLASIVPTSGGGAGHVRLALKANIRSSFCA